MTSFLRKIPGLAAARWHLRRVAGLPARTNAEILHRLQRLARSTPAGQAGVFAFPWASFCYADAGQLSTQFDEIFLRRQYAFACDSAEPVIVDCGGNVGLSALWFKREYPRCHLTVLEPDPAIANLLAANLHAAGLADVQLIRQAAWTTETELSFHAAGGDAGMISPNGALRVPAVDLAALLPECVDLLKMDIEGAEYPVLQHLCSTGAIRRVRAVVCEFHVWRARTDDALLTLDALRASGFELSFHAAPLPWLGASTSASPFSIVGRQHVLMEVFAWRPVGSSAS